MLLCLALAFEAGAMRHIGYETDAFSQVFPEDHQKNAVFSPAAFELDSAIVAECLDTIPKAKISEMLGVVLDFENSYRPVMESFASSTNGFGFVPARGFCVTEVQKAKCAAMTHLERLYNTEVMMMRPTTGAIAWFRTTMDGEMEDFTFDPGNVTGNRYSFYDLAAIELQWAEPFPTGNTRKLGFTTADGETKEMDFMADVRKIDAWENKEFTMVKLALGAGSSLYVLMPQPTVELAAVRRAMSSKRIDELLTVTKSLTEDGVYHGPAAVVLPKLELTARINLIPALEYFKIPLQGLNAVAPEATVLEFVQCARFRMAENARHGGAVEKKSEEQEVRMGPEGKKFIFNRPFVFFVYHEPSAAIPVVGQFTGKE